MAELYGEGERKAFHWLQEEIMRYSTDQTILAWSPKGQDPSGSMDVLANSPGDFSDGARILPIDLHESI